MSAPGGYGGTTPAQLAALVAEARGWPDSFADTVFGELDGVAWDDEDELQELGRELQELQDAPPGAGKFGFLLQQVASMEDHRGAVAQVEQLAQSLAADIEAATSTAAGAARAVSRVPPVVWVGAGAAVLVLLMRR
jgi:hypothetical protein